MANKDYDFSGYIFPIFAQTSLFANLEKKEITENGVQKQWYCAKNDVNFWMAGEPLLFGEKVTFLFAMFVGEAYFENTTFLGTADFEYTVFRGTASFDSTKFLSHASFESTTFRGKASFKSAKFSGNAFFQGATFAGTANFGSTTFAEMVLFDNATFSEKHMSYFRNTTFSFPPSSFQEILFPPTVIFKGCDLSSVSFTDANIEQARFEECKFEIHWDDINTKLFWGVPAASELYRNAETRYRQFKKNFEEKRDWESEGDFYHHEMLMRLMKYGAERREVAKAMPWWNPTWVFVRLFRNRGKTFFLRWYKWISDFNESPVRALYWLLGTIVVSCVVYLFLIKLHLAELDLEKAFSFASTGAIPLFGLPQDEDQRLYSGQYGLLLKWLYHGEMFFSAIVWALLILSIRQKFKR